MDINSVFLKKLKKTFERLAGSSTIRMMLVEMLIRSVWHYEDIYLEINIPIPVDLYSMWLSSTGKKGQLHAAKECEREQTEALGDRSAQMEQTRAAEYHIGKILSIH